MGAERPRDHHQPLLRRTELWRLRGQVELDLDHVKGLLRLSIDCGAIEHKSLAPKISHGNVLSHIGWSKTLNDAGPR